MITGVIIGKVSDEPRRITPQGGGNAFVALTIRRSIVTPNKTFPRFYKVLCFGARTMQQAEGLQVDDMVAVTIQDVEAECYESKTGRNPGWKASVKITAGAVERVTDSTAPREEPPAATTRAATKPTPPPQDNIDEDVPF
jgi:hypothetical protein